MLKTYFFLPLWIIGYCSSLFAQVDPNYVIEQNIERSGGEKAWNALNSIMLKGQAVLNVDYNYPMVIYHQRPYHKSVVFIMDGKEVLNEGYDGKNGWTYSDLAKKNIVIPNYKPDAFDSDLLKYKQKGFNVSFLKTEVYDGTKKCHKIELKKNTNSSSYCFDEQNFQLVMEENKDEILYYYDFKKINGLTFAMKIIGKPKEGGEYIIRFNEVKINPAIDKKKFKF